ncbi:MAG: hypothetical protein EBU61_01990 [Crocinitomicaceae bacterium]|nr:hypothetical protein [Crocinitomicaceae bacterium]
MMKGTYIFYENGKEIARHENIITKFGKRFITNYLAGNVQFNKKDIAIGIAGESTYAVADTNSRLGFEFYRLPVTLGTFDISSNVCAFFFHNHSNTCFERKACCFNLLKCSWSSSKDNSRILILSTAIIQ